MKVWVPVKFIDDHISRDCFLGSEVKRNKQYVQVQLTTEAFEELLSDAEHYTGDEFSEYPGLRKSAKATVKRLKAAQARADAPLIEMIQDGKKIPYRDDPTAPRPKIEGKAKKQPSVKGLQDLMRF